MSDVYSRVLAVTGGFGTGKSTAADLLRQEGAAIVSADELSKEEVAKGGATLAKIAQEFGPEILDAEGGLNRKKTAAIVFANPRKRRALEAILHPRIQELARERFAALIGSGRDLIVYDCPLFFEAGLDRLGFRGVILIDAEKEICLERVMKRDGLSREQAENRFDAQLPLEEKRRRADYVIENKGDVEQLKKKLRDTLAKIQAPKKR